jgi:hypothetical protein
VGSYVAKRLKFRNGKRTSLLVATDTGLPVHAAALYVNRYRIKGRSANTIHQVVRSLALLHQHLDAVGVRLLDRLSAAQFLTIPEVHRLAECAQYRADTRRQAVSRAARPAASNVVQLERLRMRHRTADRADRLDVQTQATRLRHFTDYLAYLADYVGATLPPERAKALQAAALRPLQALRAQVPAVSHRARLGARQGWTASSTSRWWSAARRRSRPSWARSARR